MTTRWASVVCTSTAHIHLDECGAPEKMGGLKLLPVRTPDGKLTPELVDVEARGFDDVHRAQPQVVSLTQTTELGTAYSVDELVALCEHAHALGMRVHMDGARVSNAAATLGRAAPGVHHRRRRRRAVVRRHEERPAARARSSWC